MAARASVFQIVNLGVEATAGTSVAADTRLTSLNITPVPSTDIAKYRSSGYRFGSLAVLNREWSEARMTGALTYNELPYLLCSLLKNVTPTGAGDEKTWVFDPSSTAAEAIKTYTVEYGSSVRAEKFTYGLVTGLTMRFNNSGAEIDGMMMGKAIQDGITLTAAPTEVPLVPVARPHTTIKLADTQAGLAGATAITKGFSVEWSMTGVYGPLFALTGTTDWAEHVPLEPTAQVKLLMEMDATGTGLRTQMRNNTPKFIRITCAGPNIDVDDYTLTIDACIRPTSAPSDPRDQEGAVAMEWTFDMFHDPTWGHATEITVVNELAAL